MITLTGCYVVIVSTLDRTALVGGPEPVLANTIWLVFSERVDAERHNQQY